MAFRLTVIEVERLNVAWLREEDYIWLKIRGPRLITNETALQAHNEGNLIFDRLKEEAFPQSFNDSILPPAWCSFTVVLIWSMVSYT